jgi:ribonucleotide reductase beta subunit family protein with ferritin-like domain
MELARLSPSDITHAIEATLTQRCTPETLFERWERQRWSIGQIDLAADRDAWRERVSHGFRALMSTKIESLVIGEYTAVDHLAVIMAGAPAESYLAYLATQSADEALHWRFVMRIAAEITESETTPRQHLARAWRAANPGMRALILHETDIAERLARDAHDYQLWLQLVAIFHLITEGVLATTGQRAIIRLLARRGLFPGMQAGFSALARDEGRHVAFGLHALREGIEEGYGDAIWDAVERVVPAAVTIDVVPECGALERALAHRAGQQLIATLERRLRSIGADPGFILHICARGAAALEAALSPHEDSRRM